MSSYVSIPGSKVGFERIGPARAQELLNNQVANQREVNTEKVKEWLRDIQSGKWGISNDAIVIVNGALYNGQHRLRAVLQSGKEQTFIVLYTDNPEIMKIMDCGHLRSVTQVMEMMGKPSAARMAAVSRWVIGYKAHIKNGGDRNTDRIFEKSFGRQPLIGWISKNEDLVLESVRIVQNLTKKESKIVSEAIGGALYYLISEACNKALAQEFVTAMYSNDASVKGLYMVLSDLRDKADKKGNKTYYPARLALCIDAFNLWKATGSVPQRLKLKQDGTPFPKIDAGPRL